jgi:hypothetical protein
MLWVMLLACGGTAAPTSDVDQAVAIAKAIDADPSGADAVLETHGLTAEAYEHLLFEIARDPEKARAFEAARGR